MTSTYANLDALPAELLRQIVNENETSRYDKQRTRVRLSMVNARLRATMLPEMSDIVWYSPEQLAVSPLDQSTISRLQHAHTLVLVTSGNGKEGLRAERVADKLVPSLV